jgi:hypothetical protein
MGGIGDEFKFHLVKWSKFVLRMKSGGLGVRNLIQFNQALLGKWLWHYAMEREALWRSVVETKYDSLRGGWCSKEVAGPFRVGVWKYIRRGGSFLSSFVRYEVGDGSKVRFWHDLCVGNNP